MTTMIYFKVLCQHKTEGKPYNNMCQSM